MSFVHKPARLTPLSTQQVKFYHQQGYVILPNSCSTNEERFSVRLFNPHLHDGFSLQMMKLPIVRGALAQ